MSVFRSENRSLAGLLRKAVCAGASMVVLAHVTSAFAAVANDEAHARLTRGLPNVDGVQFTCDPAQLDALLPAMTAYLHLQNVDPSWVTRDLDRQTGMVRYVLSTPETDTNTLSLATRREYAVQDEVVFLPTASGKMKEVSTVSQKEIILALFQHGRLTEFPRSACSVEAFRDHVRARQNIVAWAESLEWDWPNGGSARWNKRYWNKGTPHSGFPFTRQSTMHSSTSPAMQSAAIPLPSS